MTNKKISELDAATIPLDYTEEIELLQSGDNVILTIQELLNNIETMKFNLAPTPGAHETSKTYWDADAGTLAMMTDVNDVTLQIGQEIYVKARNNTGSTIENGSVVRITGALGNRPTVAKAQADQLATADGFGVATADISDNSDGYITTFGLVRDLDTSGFTEGDLLYLSNSTPGGLVNAIPGSGYLLHIGRVILSNVQGIILVLPLRIPEAI